MPDVFIREGIMGMFDDLQKQYLDARRAQDKFVSGVLNMVISDLKYEKINKQKELEDGDVLAYLQKSIKQKKEVIQDYDKAGRADLVQKETQECEFLMKLMPAQLTEAEIREITVAAKKETGAAAPSDMGKLMKEVMAKVKGRADGGLVKTIVTQVLNNN